MVLRTIWAAVQLVCWAASWLWLMWIVVQGVL